MRIKVHQVVLLASVSLTAISSAEEAVHLPQDHPYQQELRAFMETLKAEDFEPDRSEVKVIESSNNPEEMFRTWLLVKDMPRVGRKRSAPSVNLPSEQLVLSSIESEKGVVKPWVWPEPATWLANWRYPGNPYRQSKAIKLRAFVTSAVDMIMMDRMQETEPEKGGNRSDYFAPHLAMYGYTYSGIKEALPEKAGAAFETGLKKLARRLIAWGPKAEETHFELLSAVGLWYACAATDDRELDREAERYVRQFFTTERFFNPAGYFTDQGGFDSNFNGMSLYFATWLAMASDWKFIRGPVEQAWRLRAYLCLPDPDGYVTGPSHFNTRTTTCPWRDEWHWPHRQKSAAMLTDEAAHLMSLPAAETLRAAPAALAGELTAQLRENPGYRPPEKLVSSLWKFRIWPNIAYFAMVNYAYDHYMKGFYSRRLKLEKKQSPLLKMPFRRKANFVRAFEKDFLVGKWSEFGVILHTGQVSGPAGKGYYEYPGPYGFGGGALSAFWTPKTGSVILGRRGGMGYEKNFDKIEDWRLWPTHAVSGMKADEKVFSSALLRKPAVDYDLKGSQATVRVTGTIPAVNFAQGKVLEGRVDYSRTFQLNSGRLQVETAVKGYVQDKVSELYEIIPVFLGDLSKQKETPPTTIGVQVGGKWRTATAEYREKVTSIRLKRFEGAVTIKFDRPRRVKLSPQDWRATYMTKVACRNILIDLLESGDQPVILRNAKISYEVGLE